ncbi:Polyamine-modulated factor 1-binding protein 1 [Galemys pyrenaicus]|uniref:Polyamine-modulated factor 1-binding protein 1 n=1 Tax=Galemys pyrenaicus TaxID=202257 RepID=A0A8J6DQV8_GALPY|nr:Polyamine-modulated factor 1-binding protein 1 [Galemys pyrenaicus]
MFKKVCSLEREKKDPLNQYKKFASAGERDREVSSLNSKLLSLQLDIKNLHDVCKRQGKTLQENELSVEEVMVNNNHNKKPALAFKELPMDLEPSKQCHLRQLQQLKKKLLALQQELEFRTEELQTSYCSLLQYQSVLEKQTSDLVLLHHHCKIKEDEVLLYEEEMGNHENTGEKLHLAQEQLVLAGNKIVSLERSLNLYRDKYQTSLSNIELLECQVKMLEGELSGIVSQDPENKGDHSKVRIYTSSCMIQEHQETLKRLSEVWQKVSEQDDLIQELRNKLACSNSLVLEREEALIKLQADFASYTATHRHPPSSSEDCEDIKKILKHLQEQKDSQCLHVEEYQNLVKDLRMELEAVSEQKKNIMKDMMKLELDLHGLREETSAHVERKDRELTFMQRRLQEVQIQFTETQKLGLKKDKLLQEKDELLHQLEKELTQVQNNLMKKEMELEKKQQMAAELENAIQEVRQDKCKMAECAALRVENQNLKEYLEEAQQQQRMSAQQAAQYKEEAIIAQGNLEDTQRKLQNCHFMDKQKADTIQELQRELTANRYRTVTSRDRLCPLKRVEELLSEHSDTLRKLENSEKERKQLQKTLCEQESKVNELLDHVKLLKHQNREQASNISKLKDELQETTKSLEEKQEQLKKCKEKEKLLEQELERLQEEERKKEKTVRRAAGESQGLESRVRHESRRCGGIQRRWVLSRDGRDCGKKGTRREELRITCQKESLDHLQIQLDKAVQREKQNLLNTVSKDIYDELSRKSAIYQDDLAQALDKLDQANSETKILHRSLLQAQGRRSLLEDEIMAYEERMKKLNMELKKLQGFHQESEMEVHAFDKRLEEMSNQVLQWQKQHQNDLKMLASKEEQLKAFQEEMAALKENLLAEDKEVGTLSCGSHSPSPSQHIPCHLVTRHGGRKERPYLGAGPMLLTLTISFSSIIKSCCLPQRSVPKETCRLHQENDQIMCNMEQWAKEQKIANEKLGNKLREQVKYIAKLTGEKDHLHNVMVHLQQENKKLKDEIEEKKLKTGKQRLCTKVLNPCKMESPQRGRGCGALNWRGATHDVSHTLEVRKIIGIPHYSGMSTFCFLQFAQISAGLVPWVQKKKK